MEEHPITADDPIEIVKVALRLQHGLIWSERAIDRQAHLAIDALRAAGLLPMTVQANPQQPVKREPNCKPGDPVDAKGLVHAWKLVTDNGPGDIYQCDRCGVVDVD